MKATSARALRFRPEPMATARRVARQAPPRLRLKELALTALRFCGALLLSAALVLGARQAVAWARRSPRFAIRSIDLRGAVHANQAVLLARTGLATGQNLFAADLDAAQRALEADPWVASARLERRLPGSVAITLVEHRPVAVVQLGPLYLMDGQAQIFKRVVAGDPVDLPLVSGLARDEWEHDREHAQLKLMMALQAIEAWHGQALPPDDLSEVRLDEEGAITLLARDPSPGPDAGLQQVALGTSSFADKLSRFTSVRAALVRRGQRASRIDLDDEGRPGQVAAQLVAPKR